MADIPFTFGIITQSSNQHNPYILEVVQSIHDLKIPEYEVIIIGNQPDHYHHLVKQIPFDDNQKSKWITRKKNLITQHARYPNVVYMHDYLKFSPDWYEGFKKFGDKFQICMNKIINYGNIRYRDWVLWIEPEVINALKAVGADPRDCMLPYEETELQRWQYINGSFWVAKKSVMEKFPLNESLSWGDGEDVQWSQKIRQHVKFSMNPYGHIQILKPGNHQQFSEMNPELYPRFKNILLGRR